MLVPKGGNTLPSSFVCIAGAIRVRFSNDSTFALSEPGQSEVNLPSVEEALPVLAPPHKSSTSLHIFDEFIGKRVVMSFKTMSQRLFKQERCFDTIEFKPNSTREIEQLAGMS